MENLSKYISRDIVFKSVFQDLSKARAQAVKTVFRIGYRFCFLYLVMEGLKIKKISFKD